MADSNYEQRFEKFMENIANCDDDISEIEIDACFENINIPDTDQEKLLEKIINCDYDIPGIESDTCIENINIPDTDQEKLQDLIIHNNVNNDEVDIDETPMYQEMINKIIERSTTIGSGFYKKIDKLFDINIPIKDQLPKPEKNFGNIYIDYSRTSKKMYIGQAGNYTSGNRLYGTQKRWGLHIYEATKAKKDHCVYLNNAIRLYKPEDFIVTTILVDKESELNNWEKFFIKIFNCIQPNGYNIDKGGKKGNKISEETRIKISNNMKNRVITDQMRKKFFSISSRQ